MSRGLVDIVDHRQACPVSHVGREVVKMLNKKLLAF